MKQNGPWRIRSTKIVYKNPWITVREDAVIRPDGKDGIYGVVSEPGGVSTLPIDDEDNVYLAEEFRYGVGRYSFETSSGGLEPGESQAAAAKRELQEELGISATEWIPMGHVDPLTSVVVAPQHLFIARGLTHSAPNHEGTEVIEKVKFTFDEAFAMVINGKITHAPTCVLILKAANYLENERGRG